MIWRFRVELGMASHRIFNFADIDELSWWVAQASKARRSMNAQITLRDGLGRMTGERSEWVPIPELPDVARKLAMGLTAPKETT